MVEFGGTIFSSVGLCTGRIGLGILVNRNMVEFGGKKW